MGTPGGIRTCVEETLESGDLFGRPKNHVLQCQCKYDSYDKAVSANRFEYHGETIKNSSRQKSEDRAEQNGQADDQAAVELKTFLIHPLEGHE